MPSEEYSLGPSGRFHTWVRLEPNRPSSLEEEEEMTGLLDRYASRKRKRQEDAEREVDRVEGLNRLPTDGGSEMQEIVIPGSPETGSNDQSGPEDIARGEPRESTPIPPALQVVTLLTNRKTSRAMLSLRYQGARGCCLLIG